MLEFLLTVGKSGITLILEGLTLTIIGLLFYQAGKTGFRFLGLYRSKEVSQVILIFFVILAPFLKEAISFTWRSVITPLSIIQNIGVVLIFSRIVVNMLVKDWNPLDLKSIIVYVIGGLMILISVGLGLLFPS